MASGGQRAAELSPGHRVAAIEDDEITPYVITNEIGKGEPHPSLFSTRAHDLQARLPLFTVVITRYLIPHTDSLVT